jgi:hypothetical protein
MREGIVVTPRVLANLCLGVACLAAAGCGGEKAARSDVAGVVTVDGTPLVAGRIYFTPDASRQNSGPQGVADIKDGRFDTRVGRGTGGPGGPVTILIQGFDGQITPDRPMGNAIFTYEAKVELPRESATRNFDLKSAEVKKIHHAGTPH